MKKRKKIALVAHDNCKKELLEWVELNWKLLVQNDLTCTGTTGQLVEKKIKECVEQNKEKMQINIAKLKSGPLGGDQQLGALICNGEVDALIFFWDALEPQPHDVDIKALLRLATLYNIVYACTRATADFIISSPLFKEKYKSTLNEQINNYKKKEN
ncbi:MAG TPA: methylglyoxal synthase [Bacteroidales bacterium]|nr:methylglyoxal synthase [Bacteroidales bacterium]HON20261.1 methylglyoxal synthase [Bacteroidales bacterium]HOR82807.1 methylglyoxal synthase [Bacteroidales bacterium]HPJ91898.1 methylglyoxal synthase [Bacteroidales bacterium]